MRQKQAADAKQLAAENGQRAGVRKEQEKIRAAEAAEKQANADRLKTPILPQGTTGTGPLLVPLPPAPLNPKILPEAGETTTATNTTSYKVAHAAIIAEQERNQDPKVLPEAEDTENKVNTLEGDTTEGSIDLTLTEEGEGNNISGNKDLRDDTEH